MMTHRRLHHLLACALGVGVALVVSMGAAADGPARRKAVTRTVSKVRLEQIDGVVVRWHARATGGVQRPQFVTARELAFGARVEALKDRDGSAARYADKHVQAALQRHITETMLAALPVDEAPKPTDVARLAERARLIVEQQIGRARRDTADTPTLDEMVLGRRLHNAAATAEGVSADELNALLRRRARASWYLDRMVAPMLKPTDLELRLVHKRGETPFTNEPFDDVIEPLRRWFVSARLAAALDRYFRNVRSRVTVVVIQR